jgi:hypothetical protein
MQASTHIFGGQVHDGTNCHLREEATVSAATKPSVSVGMSGQHVAHLMSLEFRAVSAQWISISWNRLRRAVTH